MNLKWRGYFFDARGRRDESRLYGREIGSDISTLRLYLGSDDDRLDDRLNVKCANGTEERANGSEERANDSEERANGSEVRANG